MAFLYGDSTPSPLESNFLEFLRDALDFSVVVLSADSNIEKIRERKVATARDAVEESERLQAFGRVVVAAIQDAPKGEEGSETSRCASNLIVLAADAVNASTNAVQHALNEDLAQADADEAAQREASFKALEALLLPHAAPDAKVTRRLERQPDGSYRASLHGSAALGLDWRIALAIPEGHAFAGYAPVERLAPGMEFHAPEQTGWIKKEWKPRPQRMDRFALSEASDDGVFVVLKLRAPGTEAGFDVMVDCEAATVGATRIGGAAGNGEGDGPFDLSAEDVTKIAALGGRFREALAGLEGERLERAMFDAGEFRDVPVFREVVDRLVRQMAPVVQEISRHSLTKTELVIRRLLSDERREEIFVTKSTLREKYAQLAPEQRRLFDALGFDTLPPPAPAEPHAMPKIPAQVAPRIPTPAPQIVDADVISAEPVAGAEVAEAAGAEDDDAQPETAPLRREVKASTPPPPPVWVRPVRSGRVPSGPTWRRSPVRSPADGPSSAAGTSSNGSGESSSEAPAAQGGARTTPEDS